MNGSKVTSICVPKHQMNGLLYSKKFRKEGFHNSPEEGRCYTNYVALEIEIMSQE